MTKLGRGAFWRAVLIGILITGGTSTTMQGDDALKPRPLVTADISYQAIRDLGRELSGQFPLYFEDIPLGDNCFAKKVHGTITVDSVDISDLARQGEDTQITATFEIDSMQAKAEMPRLDKQAPPSCKQISTFLAEPDDGLGIRGVTLPIVLTLKQGALGLINAIVGTGFKIEEFDLPDELQQLKDTAAGFLNFLGDAGKAEDDEDRTHQFITGEIKKFINELLASDRLTQTLKLEKPFTFALASNPLAPGPGATRVRVERSDLFGENGHFCSWNESGLACAAEARLVHAPNTPLFEEGCVSSPNKRAIRSAKLREAQRQRGSGITLEPRNPDSDSPFQVHFSEAWVQENVTLAYLFGKLCFRMATSLSDLIFNIAPSVPPGADIGMDTHIALPHLELHSNTDGTPNIVAAARLGNNFYISNFEHHDLIEISRLATKQVELDGTVDIEEGRFKATLNPTDGNTTNTLYFQPPEHQLFPDDDLEIDYDIANNILNKRIRPNVLGRPFDIAPASFTFRDTLTVHMDDIWVRHRALGFGISHEGAREFVKQMFAGMGSILKNEEGDPS